MPAGAAGGVDPARLKARTLLVSEPDYEHSALPPDRRTRPWYGRVIPRGRFSGIVQHEKSIPAR
jgi:hypothetical protein